MKPHRPNIKICFQIIFLSLLVFSSVQASEPVYNGKPLSEWLLLNAARDDSAPEAIRQIGTNAIPTLIDILL
jgi:hypothetical protein